MIKRKPSLITEMLAGGLIAFVIYFPLATLTGETRWSAGCAVLVSGLIMMAARRV